MFARQVLNKDAEDYVFDILCDPLIPCHNMFHVTRVTSSEAGLPGVVFKKEATTSVVEHTRVLLTPLARKQTTPSNCPPSEIFHLRWHLWSKHPFEANTILTL
jgi:hypothetical protein